MSCILSRRAFLAVALTAIALWLGGLSAHAQSDPPAFDPARWLPADTSAYVQLDMTDPNSTNLTLNLALYAAAALQPERSTFESRLRFDAFIPADLLDLEDGSFEGDVLPWLTDSLTIAYGALDSSLIAAPENVLMLVPLRDPLQAATYLRRVLEGQDNLTQTTVRGERVYTGDKAALVILSDLALIGAPDLVSASLDAGAGLTDALLDAPAYQSIRDAQSGDRGARLTAWFSGDSARAALPFLLGADVVGVDTVQALGGALAARRDRDSAASLLLSGAVEAIGIQLYADLDAFRLRTRLIVQTARPFVTTDGATDDLLTWIPREAAFVQRGDSAAEAIDTMLLALPFRDYLTPTLGAFPVTVPVPDADAAPLTAPAPDDLLTALDGIRDGLSTLFDLDANLIDELNGGYALAVIPRPNNPLPVFNSAFDVLLIARADDAAGADRAASTMALLLNAFADPSRAGRVGAARRHGVCDAVDPDDRRAADSGRRSR